MTGNAAELGDYLTVGVPSDGASGDCFHAEGTPCGIHKTEDVTDTVGGLLARGLRPCYPCSEHYGLPVHPEDIPLITIQGSGDVINPVTRGARAELMGAVLGAAGEQYAETDRIVVTVETEVKDDE